MCVHCSTRVERDDLTVVTVGQADDADLRARGLAFAGETSAYEVEDRQGSAGAGHLAGAGHQLRHRFPCCAWRLDSQLGFGFEELAVGLAGFRGSGRRMEFKGQADGVTVYDSYAHHPTEIAGDLEAGRSIARGGRLDRVLPTAPVQSHSRCSGSRWVARSAAADEVVVMDVYPGARATRARDRRATRRRCRPDLPAEQVCFEPEWQRVPERRRRARTAPGDLVLTLGAGDVTEIGPLVLAQLASGSRVADDRSRRRSRGSPVGSGNGGCGPRVRG